MLTKETAKIASGILLILVIISIALYEKGIITKPKQEGVSIGQNNNIESYVEGKQIFTTRENCAALSSRLGVAASPVVPAMDTGNEVSPVSERKRVQFTTTEGIINGTYSCLEDRVNELTIEETKIKSLTFKADMCNDKSQDKTQECISECDKKYPYSDSTTFEKSLDCHHDCYKDRCKKEQEAVGAERKEYIALLSEVCP